MKKRLLLSLLCILQAELIQSGEASPSAMHYFHAQNFSTKPEFMTSITILEAKRATLFSKTQGIEAQIERLNYHNENNHPYPYYTDYHYCGHHHHTDNVGLVLVAVAVPLLCLAVSERAKKLAALQKEQVKNKLELTELDALIEVAYFEQLNPVQKKKLLNAKIEANGSEANKLTNEIPALEKTAAKKTFYSRLAMLSGANLVGTLCAMAFLKPQRSASPYIGVYFFASLLTTIGTLVKAGQTAEAGKTLNDIQNKLAELKEKSAKHSADLAQMTTN